MKREKQLNRNKDKYRLLIENLPDAFVYCKIITDEKGQPLDYYAVEANPAFEKMTGLSMMDILDKKITEVLPGIKNSSFDWIGEFGKVAMGGDPVRFVEYLEPLKRWMEVTAYSDEHGYFVNIFRDVTQEKSIIQNLEQEQLEKNTILENLAEQVAYLDLDMNIIWVNPMVTSRHKKSQEELRGKKCYQAYHGFNEPCSDCSVVTAIKAGETRTAVHRSPDDLYWQVTGTPVKNKQGQMVGVLETALNISDLIKAEQALRSSEERFRLTSELSPVGIVVSDASERTLFVNRKFEELFGYTLEEMASVEDWWGLAYPDRSLRKEVRGKWKEAVEYARKTGTEIKPMEYPVVCKDGTVRQIELRMASMGDLNIVIFTDMTERKMAENEIRYISFHDKLTGLYNRAYLEEEIQRLDTSRQLPLSVIMVDLNGLKLVNDTYGHSTGDKMLKEAAALIRDCCRKEDLAARWGGDEFVVLLPQTTEVKAWSICSRITNSCQDLFVEDVPLSMALGVAAKYEQDTDLAGVIREAEDIMYKKKLTESRSAKNAVLSALLKTLAEKSHETEAHTRNMQQVAQQIGCKLELPESELSRLDLLITLHDIGKINIAEEILTKKGPLDDQEFDIIKKHPEIGYRIAGATGEFAHVAEEILSHHERWDGSGYPRGLKGRQIPLLARITSIADAYEVMSNGRPYKKAFSEDQVLAEFRKCSGSQFDPDLVDILLQIIQHRGSSLPD